MNDACVLKVAAPGVRGGFLKSTVFAGRALAAAAWLACSSLPALSEHGGLAPWTAQSVLDFSLPALTGDMIALSASRDETVIVHFFATWCEPCVREMAALDALARDFGGRGVTVLAVDVGEPDSRVRRFFEDNPVSFTVLLDRDRAVMKQWGVMALPSSFVLARGGTPALRAEGEVDWATREIRDALTRIADLQPEESGLQEGKP